MDTGRVDVVIPANRAAVLFLLFKLAAVLTVVYWLPIRRKPPHPEVVMALVGLFILYMMWPTIRTVFTGAAIVLTDRGIVNFTGGVTFVAWHEIQEARVRSTWGSKRVELQLHDESTVLRRVGGVRGWSVRRYVEKYGGKPSIYAQFAQGGADAVLVAIRERQLTRGVRRTVDEYDRSRQA